MYLPALRQCSSPWASVSTFSASLPDALTLVSAHGCIDWHPVDQAEVTDFHFLMHTHSILPWRSIQDFLNSRKVPGKELFAAVCGGLEAPTTAAREGAELSSHLPHSWHFHSWRLPVVLWPAGTIWRAWLIGDNQNHIVLAEFAIFLKCFKCLLICQNHRFCSSHRQVLTSCSSVKGLAQCHVGWESHRENITVAKVWKTPADNS